MKLDNKLFENPAAEWITSLRIKARRKRRLTYDCMNGIVKGDRVICKKGHVFRKVGRQEEEGFPLFAVLKGRSSSICQKCPDFNQETTE